jgi:hypothetical protein
VTQSDVFRALRGGGEEYFRLRRMRVFLQEVMLHFPGVMIAELVGQFDLRQSVLIQITFGELLPRARTLQFIENAKLHPPSPVATDQ